MDTNLNDGFRLSDRYEIINKIGKGGMAGVYLAHDHVLDRKVAIKILRPDLSNDRYLTDRFHLEAKAAANLSHPNIVTIYDFGIDHDNLYIVMEYINGQDLKSLVATEGRLELNKVLYLIIQACAGLGYAHRAGLVHCDVKPQNFLVTPDLRLKVTDFGIARALASIDLQERVKIVWGSPQYFSPEQANGFPPSPASDVYSLGIILYELSTGELPFKAENSSELAEMHRSHSPKSPMKLNPAISPFLEAIIFKVLSKEPSSRYRTADQFGRILINFSNVNQVNMNEVSSESTEFISNYENQISNIEGNQESTHTADKSSPASSFKEIDWITLALGLFAALFAGGLIPFWLYVVLTIKNLN